MAKKYREGNIVADKHKKVAGQPKAKKALTKEQQLERENQALKEVLYILKKWQRFIAEEHQADIDTSKFQIRHNGYAATTIGSFDMYKSTFCSVGTRYLSS